MIRNLAAKDVRYVQGGDNGILRLALHEQWNLRCYWCDVPVPFVDIQIDHIIAHTVGPVDLRNLIALHGLAEDFDVHAPANLAPICGRCNREKSDRQFPGTVVTVKLARARDKRDQVVSRVLSFSSNNKGWASTVVLDLQLTSAADVVTRMRLLTERAQGFSDTWQIGFSTGPDGVALTYTPKINPVAVQSNVGPPPLFDLPADDADAVELGERLTEVCEYGGELAVPARYLVQPADASGTALADALGLIEPGDEVLLSAGHTQLDPATVFQLTLVTADEIVRASLTLHATRMTVGLRGGRLILQDSSGVLAIFVQTERPDHGGTIASHINGQGISGRFPYQLRDLHAFFQEAEATDQLQIRLNDQVVGSHAEVVGSAEFGRMLMALRHDTAVVAALDRLQNRTGQRFPIPDQISPIERTDLLLAAKLLDGEQIRFPTTEITGVVEPSTMGIILQSFADGPADLEVKGVYSINCGPHRLTIGRVLMHAPRASLVNTDELRSAADAGTAGSARYRVAEDTGVLISLLPM